MSDRNAEKNNRRQDEISNISAGVFRRENNNNSSTNHINYPAIHLNEYFAKNLNMAKSSISSEKMGRGGLSSSPTSSSSSTVRQMLPIALCLFTFASVLSMLIIYIDTTGGGHTLNIIHFIFLPLISRNKTIDRLL